MGTEQKVVVITGASQGIGAALVKAYRDRSYRIVATSRSIKPSNDDQVLAVPGDIADRNTAERAITEGVARFGRIDTLVNNAGIFTAKPFTQYTAADYAAILGVNLTGFFHITQLAIAEMEKQGSGHVVQITTSLVDHAMAGVPSVLASLTKGGRARRHQDVNASGRDGQSVSSLRHRARGAKWMFSSGWLTGFTGSRTSLST